MFGIDSGELLIIAVVALLVIGPKDLPRVMRTIGEWTGRARGMARHFRSGLDTMIRESELDDMDKQWKANNARIMREHPATPDGDPDSDWGQAAPDATLVPPDQPQLPLTTEAPTAKPRPSARRATPRKTRAAPPIPAPAPPGAEDRS